MITAIISFILSLLVVLIIVELGGRNVKTIEEANLHHKKIKEEAKTENRRHISTGIFLVLSAISFILIGVSQGGNKIVCLVVGLFCLGIATYNFIKKL